MISLIILLWILPSINAGGQDHFQTVYDDIDKMIEDQVSKIQLPLLEVYTKTFLPIATTPPTFAVLEKTQTSIYILDTYGSLLSDVRNISVGIHLSDFMNNTFKRWNSTYSTLLNASDTDMLFILGGYRTQNVDDTQCYGYNLTLADNNNGTMIEEVTIKKCGGSKLRSFITGKTSEFGHLKQIILQTVPITELTIEDLVDFPELQMLLLDKVPIAFLENGLLCNSLNMTIMRYINSFGYLTVFPRQIFNCTIQLNLEYLHLENHNIASLPAHAFGSAAEQLRVLRLEYIGLEVIYKDAFAGLMHLQLVRIHDNNLLHILGAMIPQSTRLQVISYIDNIHDRKFNLSSMNIEGKYHLQMFVWHIPHISSIEGSFCSNQSKTDLEIVTLQGLISDQSNTESEKNNSGGKTRMIETLPVHVFDHCISLKSLAIQYTGLSYLPDRLFATNVSQLEALSLSGNRLNSNISWSDVLRPLHRLKYLKLSVNMLTSWTYNLSSLWSLEKLDLSHNNITEISHMAFINMTMLKFLSLENNNLIFLAPEVQRAFTHIPMLNLARNNIHKMEMSAETMLSDIITLDMTSNSLIQMDLPSVRNCSPPCGKISLFGDNNKLPRFVLPCSDTHQYGTVSLANNKLTDINSIFPNNLVQQCSLETLNLSGNYFKSWTISTRYEYIMSRTVLNDQTRAHNITTLDMTHCRMEFINKQVFLVFTINFLDLRENSIHVLPIMYYVLSRTFYPSVLDVQINPIMCYCNMLWVKRYLNQEAFNREHEILVTNCMEPVWNTSMDIVTVPDTMFMCNTKCPQQIRRQCDKADRCYQTVSDNHIDATVCLSSHNNNNLSSVFITILYRLYVSGFNLSTLKLPYTKPHSLTHLNMTSCNISIIPEKTFTNISRLQLLVLARNAIQTLATATFHPLVWLRYLDLSNNQLLSFVGELILPLFHLDILYLHENKMEKLRMETLEEFKMLNTLSLHDNPWICECNDTFGHWIVEQLSIGILLSPENITCSGANVPVMLSNVTCTTHTKVVHPGSKAAIVISSVLASVLAVILIVCILIYKYRRTLGVLIPIYIPPCTKRTENDGVRGVFAICDDEEMGAREWIRQSLMPFIESACPLIWSQRDFVAGEYMAVNIQNAVEQTNCAIVLLSRRFLQNEWSCCMFQTAFNEVRGRKRPYKIILILTPDVTVNMLTSDENCPHDLKVMLKTQRLVYMSKKFYYETLLYLLPDSCKTKQQIMTIRGEDIITTFYKHT